MEEYELLEHLEMESCLVLLKSKNIIDFVVRRDVPKAPMIYCT